MFALQIWAHSRAALWQTNLHIAKAYPRQVTRPLAEITAPVIARCVLDAGFGYLKVASGKITRRTVDALAAAVRLEATEAVLNHLGASRAAVAGVHRRRDWNEDKRAGPDKSTAPLAPLLLGEVPSLWPDLSRSGQRRCPRKPCILAGGRLVGGCCSGASTHRQNRCDHPQPAGRPGLTLPTPQLKMGFAVRCHRGRCAIG